VGTANKAGGTEQRKNRQKKNTFFQLRHTGQSHSCEYDKAWPVKKGAKTNEIKKALRQKTNKNRQTDKNK